MNYQVKFFTTIAGLKKHLLALSIILLIFLSCSSDKQQVKPDRFQGMVEKMLIGRDAGIPIEPLTHAFGSFSIEEAYQVQDRLVQELHQRLGQVIGYKVAFASRSAQQQFGIDGPASGPLFQLQRLANGSVIGTGDFIGILIETEVAFTIGKRIEQPIADVEVLKSYIKWLHAAFDMGEERFDTQPATPGVADRVADGAGAHMFVIGPGKNPGEIDVAALTLKLSKNDEIVASSPASNVMGSPWLSLLWLVNHVTRRGNVLNPGDVILTGTAAPAFKATGLEAIGVYLGDCGPLGQVTCTIR